LDFGKVIASGGLPTTTAYAPADLARRSFICWEWARTGEFHDAAGRPYRIYRGQPIQALL
jgi:hypothetical protein